MAYGMSFVSSCAPVPGVGNIYEMNNARVTVSAFIYFARMLLSMDSLFDRLIGLVTKDLPYIKFMY